MSKILLAYWSANFAMDDEREKLRTKEVTNEIANIISSLNIGSEEYVQSVGEDC